MLTDSEKKWLEKREMFAKRDFNRHYSCAYCEKFSPNRLCHSALCPIDVAHVVPRDAAEFEARVAAKLAGDVSTYFELQEGVKVYLPWREQVLLRLKHARLAVEEEMDK